MASVNGGGRRFTREASRTGDHQVDVEVVHGLPAPPPDVRREPIAVVRDALIPSDAGSDGEEATEHRAVTVGQVRRGRDVDPGHEEDVGRGPRGDVADRDDEVVFMEGRRRQLTGDDPAEQAIS
jgi:hypothetical protein